MLTVENLVVSYGGARALHGVSLDVGRGEVVALLGPNGAGKSTVLRTISALQRADAGEIRFDGTTLGRTPAHEVVRSGLAHVPEGRRLFGSMTVRENLELGLRGKVRDLSVALAPALDLFPELGRLQRRLAFSLSGGEQQMVAVARALLSEPTLIMLDEPTLGLAPVIVDRIVDTIDSLRKSGIGVLLVEQHTGMALECSDRGYVLVNGTIRLSGSSEELRDSEDVVSAYLGGAQAPSDLRGEDAQ